MKATVNMLDGSMRRLTMPTATWTGSDEMGAGVTRRAIFIGPKTGRVVVETYSIWDDGHGRCIGTMYHEADQDEVAFLAAEYQEVSEAVDSAEMEEL